jgi:hypothetical protein
VKFGWGEFWLEQSQPMVAPETPDGTPDFAELLEHDPLRPAGFLVFFDKFKGDMLTESIN